MTYSRKIIRLYSISWIGAKAQDHKFTANIKRNIFILEIFSTNNMSTCFYFKKKFHTSFMFSMICTPAAVWKLRRGRATVSYCCCSLLLSNKNISCFLFCYGKFSKSFWFVNKYQTKSCILILQCVHEIFFCIKTNFNLPSLHIMSNILIGPSINEVTHFLIFLTPTSPLSPILLNRLME